MEVGTAARAIGDGAALNLREHAAQQGIVVADHDHSVEGDVIHKIQESAFDVAHVAIAVHVFAIDVGDDGENWRELEKRAVTLVGLGDEILRFTETGVRSHGVDAAADDYGRIELAACQYGRDHGSGCGLAMHSGDGDAVLQAHQFGQHFGALDDGNVEGVRLGDFWIGRRNG